MGHQLQKIDKEQVTRPTAMRRIPWLKDMNEGILEKLLEYGVMFVAAAHVLS